MYDSFCPAPWKSLYFNTDSCKVCCANVKSLKLSPEEFLKSDFLQEIRTAFIKGEKHPSCSFCWKAESLGLQSIRNHQVSSYGNDTTPEIKHLELRASNLCNFECRMCNAESSSLIAGEVRTISDENFEEILKISEGLDKLYLTGGEPMLIKHYYTLLDHLIEQNKTDMKLMVYTNCSVYNQKFIDRISKFKCILQLSIDGVGLFAEAQRVGTDWNVVHGNVMKLISIGLPTSIHTTMTKINLLGVSSLVDFYLEVHKKNPRTNFSIHTAHYPENLAFYNLDSSLFDRAIEQLDLAINKLRSDKFDLVRRELVHIKQTLEKKKNDV